MRLHLDYSRAPRPRKGSSSKSMDYAQADAWASAYSTVAAGAALVAGLGVLAFLRRPGNWWIYIIYLIPFALLWRVYKAWRPKRKCRIGVCCAILQLHLWIYNITGKIVCVAWRMKISTGDYDEKLVSVRRLHLQLL